MSFLFAVRLRRSKKMTETSKLLEFVYIYRNYDETEKVINYPIEIPFKDNCDELSYQIVAKMDPMMGYLNAEEGKNDLSD